MCSTCGCSDSHETRLTVFSSNHEVGHSHDADDQPRHGDDDHPHDHHAAHEHGHANLKSASRTLQLEQDILARNNHLADHNRGWLESRRIVAFNLMSSPGAGKTSLLERTIRDVGAEGP